ncbi:MAG: alpha/beta hydrolase [Synechococcus sp.]
MKQVIAMHGWSGDGRTWGPWERHFNRHGWSWQSGERGYSTLPPHTPNWLTPPHPPGNGAEQRRVVVAHSLGPHLLAAPLLAEATDVVLLASFSRFVPEGRAGRALRTGLIGMERCIGTASETSMLQTFLQRAVTPCQPSALPPGPVTDGLSAAGRQRLRADLHQLMATTGLPPGLPGQARVLVVNAEADAIVVAEARQQLQRDLLSHLEQPAETWVLQGCGHALLVPELLQHVRQWLDREDE